MLVKKFEAPTLQEALAVVKRELGPEAIILSTKNKGAGFGLMKQPSVEISAAISERHMTEKKKFDSTLSHQTKDQFQNTPASHQAKVYNRQRKFTQKSMPQGEGLMDSGGLSSRSPSRAASSAYSKDRAVRYIDMQDDEQALRQSSDSFDLKDGAEPIRGQSRMDLLSEEPVRVPDSPAAAHSAYTSAQIHPQSSVEKELHSLKEMVKDLALERDFVKRVGEFENLNPAFMEIYRELQFIGVSEKIARKILRDVSTECRVRNLSDEDSAWAMAEKSIADRVRVFESKKSDTRGPQTYFIIGAEGSGKTLSSTNLAVQNQARVFEVDFKSDEVKPEKSSLAKLAGLAVERINSFQDFKSLYKRFGRDRSVVVDLNHFNLFDERHREFLRDMISHSKNPKIKACLDLTQLDQVLDRQWSKLSSFQPESFILTKGDQLSSHGRLLDFIERFRCPLSHLGLGKRIPRDLKAADKEFILNLIFEGLEGIGGGESDE
jgi:flagellar biosynthesis protein FlhF